MPIVDCNKHKVAAILCILIILYIYSLQGASPLETIFQKSVCVLTAVLLLTTCHRQNSISDNIIRGGSIIRGGRLDKERSRQESFEYIYKKGLWKDEADIVSSGNGSTLAATLDVRTIISKIIKDYHLRSIVDAGCGDITWMPVLLADLLKEGISIQYTGCDITKFLVEQNAAKYEDNKNIKFLHRDLVTDDIPKGDLVICRDVIQHLLIGDGIQALKNISNSGSRYLLATTYPRQSDIVNNRELKKTGYCISRDLMRAPYNLPDPIVMFNENNEVYHKYLGLWKLPLVFKEVVQIN
jgi:SAM-dependent methyltransferase